MNPDANGWYRVHAIDGSGLDYSTTVFDPEVHVLVDEPAADRHGNPFPASAPAVVEQPQEPEKAQGSEKPGKSADKKPEEATR